MKISVYVASVFSKDHKGGNKAGVVFIENTLTTTQKMAIAKQLGYAETAFISESEIADYKFEYFTPKEEVDLCGHATIGSFAILMHLNKLFRNRYTIETNSGVLTITIKDDIIFMEQNKPIFYDVVSPNEFIDCFDIKDIDNKYPIQAHKLFEDDLIPVFPYKRPMTKKGFFKKYDYVYDEYFDRYICPNMKTLNYTTTNREGYKEYKSNPNDCSSCPFITSCTESKNKTKLIMRHLWEDEMERSEDIRHSLGMKQLYGIRKQTTERLFGTAKEFHGLRYTNMIGKEKCT